MAERVLSQIVELDVDKCQNVNGVAPCTANRVESGTAQAGGASTITLRAAASAVNDAYKGMVVRITGGLGAGQEGIVAGYVGATKVATMTAAWATPPDVTSTYDVIDRSKACYNTFRTCQSKPNYTRGTQTISFTLRGAPIPGGVQARPYITDIKRAETKLDPEQGLAVRSTTSVEMTDEPDSDVQMDPYIRFRTAVAGGTFWTRFFARNLNWQRRAARVKQSFVSFGVFGATTTERFLVDSLKGPNKDGNVVWTLKDPTKQLDQVKAPGPTSGKLSIDLLLTDMQLTLDTGKGSQYASSGYVRVGDEVIRYDGKAGDVLTWSLSSYRAVFGTAAGTPKAGTVVQQCLVYSDVAFSDVIHDLYTRAGIPDADMDLVGLAFEDATWLGTPYRVTACITDPEAISALVEELLQQVQMMAWWSPTLQKHKFKCFMPSSPADVVARTIDDTSGLIEQSVEIERLENLRLTMAAVYFGKASAVSNVSESRNYSNGELYIDADAESPNEYNGRVTGTVYSRWFGTPNILAMRALAQRTVGRRRDAPENMRSFNLDPKDLDIVEGVLVDVKNQGFVNSDGSQRTARVLVTARADRGTHIEYAGRVTTFDRRYGFIAPNGTPDYPNNNGYACVSQNTGLMTDGSNGFLVI